MRYKVGFYNVNFNTYKDVEVKAESESGALRNARRRGYLKKNGWEWISIFRFEQP